MLPTKDLKKYLPSKQFTSSIVVILIIFIFTILVRELFSFAQKKLNNESKEGAKITVEEIVQQDSNKNGIPDWEEYVWGLDPTKNGSENKAFILAKKATLLESGEIVQEQEGRDISDNEMLARDLFATIISLQASGQLTPETIESLSSSVGVGTVAEELPNKYTLEDLKITTASRDSVKLYYDTFVSIYKKYQDKDLGNEVTLISQGLGNNDVLALRAAKSLVVYYQEFAEDLSKIEIPSSVHLAHLDIINNLEKIAISLDGLTMSMADPLLGMRSVILYNKYSADFVSNIEEITSILQLYE